MATLFATCHDVFYFLSQMSISDNYQTEALADIGNRFGWRRYGIIASIDDYGELMKYSDSGITVLYHFRTIDLMRVIIYKNDKQFVTLYNVIFSNMKSISHLSYIFY